MQLVPTFIALACEEWTCEGGRGMQLVPTFIPPEMAAQPPFDTGKSFFEHTLGQTNIIYYLCSRIKKHISI